MSKKIQLRPFAFRNQLPLSYSPDNCIADPYKLRYNTPHVLPLLIDILVGGTGAIPISFI